MKRRTFRILAGLFAVTGSFLLTDSATAGDIELRPGCIAHFASETEGAEVIGQKDEFIQRLSPFDRAARMKTDEPVSEKQFLAFVKSNVRPWSSAHEAKIEQATTAIRPALEKLSIGFPAEVTFVNTTGAEEGQAFYTRDTSVIMPDPEVEKMSGDDLQKTVAHELFHILSRTNPEVREKLYHAIGFSKCNEVQLPPELADRKITNPDAPRNDHAIQVRFGETQIAVVPILLSTSEKYDRNRGGKFFSYLQFKFLPLANPQSGKPKLIELADLSGFFEQVGRNTDYIIHPEEILADNFALLVLGAPNIKSPEIIAKIRSVAEKN